MDEQNLSPFELYRFMNYLKYSRGLYNLRTIFAVLTVSLLIFLIVWYKIKGQFETFVAVVFASSFIGLLAVLMFRYDFKRLIKKVSDGYFEYQYFLMFYNGGFPPKIYKDPWMENLYKNTGDELALILSYTSQASFRVIKNYLRAKYNFWD